MEFPATAVPMGLSAGKPVGVQVVSLPGGVLYGCTQDVLCLQANGFSRLSRATGASKLCLGAGLGLSRVFPKNISGVGFSFRFKKRERDTGEWRRGVKAKRG